MKKISKVVHNIKNWKSVSGVAQTGIHVNSSTRKNYYFGLEEWNNSDIFKKHKLFYLDSFRSYPRFDYYEKIELINFNKSTVFHIGTLVGVTSLKCKDIQEIRNKLINDNWLNEVEKNFNDINDTRPIESHLEYMQCWNSEDIIAPINEGFILNLRYEDFIYFDQPINLTLHNKEVNSLWKRLIKLYDLKIEFNDLFYL
jgi:hypothetical protein